MEPQLTFALKDGKITHISEVESGLICGCVCPKCGRRLVAKKGDIKIHHFAHEDNSDCSGAVESALHLAAKSILESEKKIGLPSYRLRNLIIWGSRMLIIEEVKSECSYGSIIPDVTIYKNGRPFFIEIKVTHPVDEAKLQKIRDMGIYTLEVDLSTTTNPTIDSIKQDVIESKNNKKWLNFPNESKWLAEIEKFKVRAYWYDSSPHVWHCPRLGRRADCGACKPASEYVQGWQSLGVSSMEQPEKYDYVYCRWLFYKKYLSKVRTFNG